MVPFGAGTAFEGQIGLHVGIGVGQRRSLVYSSLILSLQRIVERIYSLTIA